jgi:quercetin dioxygenase-like cupin family protein
MSMSEEELKTAMAEQNEDGIVHKSWGYEQRIFNGPYCVKLLVYTKRGIASSLHYHEKKQETFVFSSGEFMLEIGDEPPVRVGQGNFITLPPGTKHRVRCILPGVIVECSTFDDPKDCVRLVPSE